MTSGAADQGSALPGTAAADVARLRRSRLARLRPEPVVAAPPIDRTRPATTRSDRADLLAKALDGEVLQTIERPIVVVESRIELAPQLAGLRHLPEPVDPDRPLILFDTETTALGTGTGNVAFLVGVGTWHGDEFVTRQLVLPEQSDEGGFLSALQGLIPAEACLVSYNGRSFDWPLLVARYRLHGRTPPTHAAHLDLLPLARTLWRHRLGDARLASVEASICGVQREHDLPGGLVPARYLDYLRTGRGSLLREVLVHNRQDVVSMALLLNVLARDLAPAGRAQAPSPSVHAGDLGGLGRAFVRRRRHAEALACFDAAMERLSQPWELQRYEEIAVERARTLTRLGLRDEAEGAWHAIALEGGRHAGLAWLHVAKHREHDAGDFAAALQATERARALAERSRLFGRRDRVVERDLSRRVPRLRRRLAAAGSVRASA